MDPSLLEQLNLEASSAKAGFGSDEYFAARFVKGKHRHAVWAILALKSVIENIPLTVSDPGVARLKLAWWRNQIEETDTHPLYGIAKSLWVEHELLESSLAKLITTLDRHYVHQMFESELERQQWFVDAYQSLYAMLGSETNREAHQNLCGPVESARSLLRLRDEMARQFVRVSKETFKRENIAFSTIAPDPNSDSLRNLVSAELASAHRNLDEAIVRCSSAPSAVKTYALLTKRQLEETIADGAELLSRKVELTPLGKLWIAWRNR